ncbi:N-acetylmuramoyl-L-alanine amidase [Ferruginibacter sp.]|uniref:N-acetylmuramoyl-L-alanine amidase n=1 Tax=Ferruginibacter sp. TaxID=1940288 RepID=UPI00374CE559
MLLFSFYLLKVIICSGVLFAYYWLLLRNKIFHQYNRFYLLASIGLSLLAPLMQINILHYADSPAPAIKLLQVVTSSNEYLDEIVLTAHKNNFTVEQLVSLLYVLTTMVFLSLFIQVFIKIHTLLQHHQQTVVDNICFVNTTAKGTPFSFLKYIFWNDHIEINTITGNQIFKHELAHVQQKHSYDKLLINAVLIFFWCNPFFWLVRKELYIIHEFMADKIAVEDSDTEAFAAMILQATYPQHQFALTNPFFYSPIKRRLIMLTKNKNAKAGYIGRVLVLPLAVLLFAAFTLKTKTIINTPVYHGKKITVVLDAGHGGKDFGTVSLNGKIIEKDMALSIVKKIQSLNTNPNIHLILIRETDIYQTPPEKADFNNAQHPDLFISIHVNGTSKDSAAIKTGMSVYVFRKSDGNTFSSKLFASAIINEFTNNYKIPVGKLPVQQEVGIWVLKQSVCPAVLIETGYITNKKDLAYLQTEAAKETIAKNVLAAIEKYALQTETTITNDKVLIDTIPKKNELPDNILYVLNDKIMGSGKEASNKVDKELNNKVFKNLMVKIIKEKEAIIKYGELGKNGAVELSYDPNETTALQSNGSKTVDTASSNANRNNFDAKSDDKIFTKVENEPKFPGGDSAWKHYLQKNLNPAIPIYNGAPAGTYRVIVKFIVSKDGSISNIEPETKHGYGMETAAVELIEKGPKWKPAVQNNLIVTAYKKQPITFVIEDQ